MANPKYIVYRYLRYLKISLLLPQNSTGIKKKRKKEREENQINDQVAANEHYHDDDEVGKHF